MRYHICVHSWTDPLAPLPRRSGSPVGALEPAFGALRSSATVGWLLRITGRRSTFPTARCTSNRLALFGKDLARFPLALATMYLYVSDDPAELRSALDLVRSPAAT